MLGDVDRSTAIFASEREALNQPKRDQDDRRRDAPGRITRQEADEEGAHAHQRHGDQEGVFAPDEIAEAAEDQRAERAYREARRKGEQREDEADIRRHVGEEVFGEERAKRSVDVEVVPLENRTQRGRENDL